MGSLPGFADEIYSSFQRKYKKYRKNRVSTSTEEPADSKEIQGDDEFKILEADEKAEEAAVTDKQSEAVEVPVEPTDEIIDNRVPIIGMEFFNCLILPSLNPVGSGKTTKMRTFP